MPMHRNCWFETILFLTGCVQMTLEMIKAIRMRLEDEWHIVLEPTKLILELKEVHPHGYFRS